MLKNIDPALNADVLHALRAMGHGDTLVISDTNFPSDSVARHTTVGKVLRRAKMGGTAAMNVGGVEELLNEVRAMPVSPESEMWSDYYDGRSDVGYYDGSRASLDQLIAKSPKYAAVAAILQRLSPRTVLDIACNRGPYSQMAASYGASVVGIGLKDRGAGKIDAGSHAISLVGTLPASHRIIM